MRQLASVLLLTCVTLSGNAVAQTISSSLGIYVYPGDGQSIEQLAVDENECHQWARQTTGVDPNNPMAGVQVQAPQQQSGRTGGAARGAAKGALIGAVTDNDKSEYAAAGAVIGAARGARRRQAQNQQAQQQAQAQAEAQGAERLASFKKAYSACMGGRSYTVT